MCFVIFNFCKHFNYFICYYFSVLLILVGYIKSYYMKIWKKYIISKSFYILFLSTYILFQITKCVLVIVNYNNVWSISADLMRNDWVQRRTRSRTGHSRTAGLQLRSPQTRSLCCGCRCDQRWPRPRRTPAGHKHTLTHTHTHTFWQHECLQRRSVFTQQEPQEPWSRIWLRVLQKGHSVRGSKLTGSFMLVPCFTLQMERKHHLLHFNLLF